MSHLVYYPPPHLKRYIRHYFVADLTDKKNENSVLDVYADVYPRMIFQHKDGHSGFATSDCIMPISYLSGLKTKSISFSIKSNAITIVSFFPDALKVLFGIDCNELLNAHPDLENFAPKSLTDLIIDTTNPELKIDTLNAFFTKKLELSIYSKNRIVDQATTNLSVTTNENCVSTFIKENATSERQLERKFKTFIGITPKQFLRIKRFEKAIPMLQNENISLSELAFSLDYFDQSHFIKEFKEFSGITPNTFRHKNTIVGESNAVLSVE